MTEQETPISTLLQLSLTRNIPLSVSDHQHLTLLCAISCFHSRNLSQAQSFLSDALTQAQNINEPVERCLYWQAVLDYEQRKFISCKNTCDSLFARPDLPLDLFASVALLLANTLPLLPDVPVARLTLPPVLSSVQHLFPDSADIFRPQKNSHLASIDHLKRCRIAFALTYVARLANAMASHATKALVDSSATCDSAFLNLAAYFEFRPQISQAYARISGVKEAVTMIDASEAGVASLIGRRVSTTKALLRMGRADLLGSVGEEVVETKGDAAERLRFWATKARSATSEEEKFAAARKLALVADDVHDFALLQEAVTIASEYSGPQSAFYKELQEVLRRFDGRKSEIYFLPANPPGLVNSGPPTPRASEAARRSSRVSNGGLPTLSPWKPSLAELSP
jgi:hypothetical protein